MLTGTGHAVERRMCVNVLALRRGAPRRTCSVRTRRAMSAGPHAQVSLLFTRRPRRRKPPGSKRVLADVRRYLIRIEHTSVRHSPRCAHRDASSLLLR